MPPLPPTTVAPTISTTTTEREPFAVEWSRPTGSFELDANDVLALRDDGSLVLFESVSSAAPPSEVLVEDVAIRLGDDGELSDVAGVVAGALVLGSCCDAGGGLWSLEEPGGRLRRFADGEHPTYSRERDWLAAVGAGDAELLVHDVPSELVTSPAFDAGSVDADVRGILWASDDESWFVLVTDAAGASTVVRVEARPPFEAVAAVPLDPLFADATTTPQFAGLGPAGEIGLWSVAADEVVIRFVDGATLQERPDRERVLSPTATSVRIGPDGGGLLWIDGGALRYLPLFEAERELGQGYRAAWFVG